MASAIAFQDTPERNCAWRTTCAACSLVTMMGLLSNGDRGLPAILASCPWDVLRTGCPGTYWESASSRDGPGRSEERRVGKECRARRSPWHKKEKESKDVGIG